MDPRSSTGGDPLVVRNRPSGYARARPGRVSSVIPPARCVHHARCPATRMSIGLGRDEIRALLDDLSAELSKRGARADLFLVGGAAIAVAYDSARATRDLDAVFLPTDVVRQAAISVAERRGLAKDWLNDAVKGFMPGPDPDAQRYYESDAL